MAELFTNPMTSMTEAYKGTTAMLEDVAASQDLKQAVQQTPVEKEVNEQGQPVADKPVDLFKVNSLAAQMAAQRGDTRSSDKFMKQAQEYKKDDLIIQSKELAVAQDKLEAMEQQVNAITNPADAIDAVMKSKVPQDRKLAEIAKIRAIGDDPEKFKAYKDQLQSSVMTAKDRLSAADRALKMKQQHEEKMELIKDRQARDRQTAWFQSQMIDLQRDKLNFQQDKFESEFGLKGAKTVADVETRTRALIAKVAKDPLLSKEERKAEIERISQGAERTISRIESAGKGKRGGKDTGGDSSSSSGNIPQEAIDMLIADPSLEAAFNEKFKTNGMATPAKEFLERAKQDGKLKNSPAIDTTGKSTAQLKTELSEARTERDAYRKEIGNPPGNAQKLKDPKAAETYAAKKKKLDELDAKVDALKSAWIKSNTK